MSLEFLLKKNCADILDIITPESRGSMLCLRFKTNAKKWADTLHQKDVVMDFREPDIIRATPAPLYTSFQDVFQLVQILKEAK